MLAVPLCMMARWNYNNKQSLDMLVSSLVLLGPVGESTLENKDASYT